MSTRREEEEDKEEEEDTDPTNRRRGTVALRTVVISMLRVVSGNLHF